VLGSKDAPVTMYIYEDIECLFSKRFEQNAFQKKVDQYIRDGQVKVAWKDFPLERLHPWAIQGAVNMECVYRQDAEAFWKEKPRCSTTKNPFLSPT